MKKIITVLVAVLAMSSMFAYIPNKTCVKVKRNKIKYYENTDVCNLLAEEAEPKDIGLSGNGKICVEWVIDKYITVERNVDWEITGDQSVITAYVEPGTFRIDKEGETTITAIHTANAAATSNRSD